ncbi:MAG TPA: BON domain-containing protein [Phenylobacterium sp.]|nr:BON domain-containing protein [Phenylobacterium sp.]
MPETTETASDLTRVDGVRAALRRSFAARELRIDRLAFERDRAFLIEGEVASLAAKKRALRIAAIASDARGLVDRLHVKAAAPMTDGEIRVRVAQLFALDPRFQDLAIEQDRNPSPLAEDRAPVTVAPANPPGRVVVEVLDGVVTLDGSAPSLVRKRLAGAIPWRVAGVRDVINGLAVEPPEDDGPDQVEEAIREALDGNPLFDDTQIKVGVFGDYVRLTGLVHSHAARQVAEAETWRIQGVDEVINEIEVRAGS